jgi:membrane-bound lytic murein transglycosylase B
VLALPGAPGVAGGAGKAPARAVAAGDKHGELNALEAQAGLPHDMLWRVFGIESVFGSKPGPSSAGALGPFQFIKSTGADFGLITDDDRMDFGKSSKAAARYLSRLMTKYGGNVDMALAGYNWGPKNVDKYGIGNLNDETAGYLGKYHAMEGGGGITVNNNFNITGTNAKDIADKVAGAQSRTYGDALRNAQGATR